jgi:hypothetical protein
LNSVAAQTTKKENVPMFYTKEEEEEANRLKHGDSGPNRIVSEANYPPELKCPFGDHILKDAVVLPCCGLFVCCDECIKLKISNDEFVECPHDDCPEEEVGSLENLVPAITTRKMVNDFLNDVKLANQRANNANNAAAVAAAIGNQKDVFYDLFYSEDLNDNSNSATAVNTFYFSFSSLY